MHVFGQNTTTLKTHKQYEKEVKANLSEAEFLYSHSWYHKAIPYFEKIVFHEHDAQIYAQLGDCYAAIQDQDNAAKNYKESLKVTEGNDSVQLKYARTLMMLSNYDEALKWIAKYLKKHPDETRAKNMQESCTAGNNLSHIIINGEASLLDCNGDGSEFAPTLRKGELVFVANAGAEGKKKDKWSDMDFYSICAINIDTAGHGTNAYSLFTSTKKVNSNYHTGPCTFSADGKQMYFSRTRFKKGFLGGSSVADKNGNVHLEIMIASGYNDSTRTFESVKPFKYNNINYSTAHPAISPSGNMLVFVSDMPGGQGGSDLYYCLKNGDDWSEPQNAGKMLNTEGEEVFPYFADNNTLFFSSDGQIGYGGLDIYKTSWDTAKHSFSTPQNVGRPINSPNDDMSLALYADGRSSYFSSNRPSAKKGDNIYYYKRIVDYLNLNVLNTSPGTGISNFSVALNSADDKRNIDGVNGAAVIQLQPETKYTVTVSSPTYADQAFLLNTIDIKESNTVSKIVRLESKNKPEPVPTPTVKETADTNSEFEAGKSYKLEDFYFEYNKADLVDAAKVPLENLLGILKKYPKMVVRIDAYTDCRGSEKYNTELSDRRGEAIVRYLEAHGIAKKRLSYKGMGNENPAVVCADCEACSEADHRKNRRIEFYIMSLK